MKHFIQEFLEVEEPPAILVFNIKGQDFYDLERPMSDDQWEQIKRKNPSVELVWKKMNYRQGGIPTNRVTYYPLSQIARGRQGNVYSLRFASLTPDRRGINTLLRLIESENLPEASKAYLIDYFLFFKEHIVARDAVPVAHGWRGQSWADTLANFVGILNSAQRQAGRQNITIFSSAYGTGQDAERVTVNAYTAEAILRALRSLERLNLFDVGSEIPLNRILTAGHISVIDVATNDSPRAQEIFIRNLLQSLFNYINQRQYENDGLNYRGLALFLDEAWRFFRSPTVLDVVETISRMGRSLRIGLWLADQSIPTGAAETTILNNLRTRILGIMSAETPSQIRRIMPLDDKLIASLQNLRRGTGIFFNIEHSRLPVPCVIPACRCFHGEESEG